MPIDDILYGVIGHAKRVGHEKLMNLVIFDTWEKYRGQDLNDPCTRMKYSCDIITGYYGTLEQYWCVMKKNPKDA